MGKLWKKITHHPIISSTIAGISLLAALWPIFFKDTLPGVLTKMGWGIAMPSWYYLLVILIGCAVVTLYIVLIRAVLTTRKEAGQIEGITGELTTARRALAEMQAKLSTLESTQPHLKTEPLPAQQRKSGHSLHSGGHTFRNRIGYFTLLRVTNEPKSLNSKAIAHNIYAKISYCNEQWDELFPSVHGGWFSLWQSHGPNTIGPPSNSPGSLAPYESTYLGITLRYQWEKEIGAHAIDASSGEWPDWLNPDFALSAFPQETTYVKVIIGCDGFRDTCYYVLEDDNVNLSPVDPPH